MSSETLETYLETIWLAVDKRQKSSIPVGFEPPLGKRGFGAHFALERVYLAYNRLLTKSKDIVGKITSWAFRKT